MAFTLGQAPETLRVVLVSDADFVHALDRQDGESWDGSTSVWLEIKTRVGTVEWVASISGARLQWAVDAAVVDAVIADRPSTVRLWYTLPDTNPDNNGELRLLWAQGEVEVL